MIKQKHFVGVMTLFTLSGLALAKPHPGVVVTSTTVYSEARNAGIRKGDLLLSWKRGLSGGTIESPLDLMRIEIEQAPLAPTTLVGLRNSQPREWQLGQEDWSINTRPSFTAAELRLYLEARHLVEIGERQHARRLWQSLASTPDQRAWMHSWCAWDAANSMSRRRHWNLANNLFRESVTAAPHTSPAKVFLLQRWARVLERTGDLNKVDMLLTESLSEAERTSHNTLVTSWILNELGKVSTWRRDVKRASQLYRQALSIDQHLAPESVVTARTLTNLAAVSLKVADANTAEQFLNQAQVLLDTIPTRGTDFAIMDGYLSVLAARRGDLAKAKQYLTEAEAIVEPRWSGTILQARFLSALAEVAIREGDLDKAEVLVDRGMEVYEADPSDPILGIYLHNESGMLAEEREDLDTAMRNAHETDHLWQQVAPVSLDHGGSLTNLAQFAFDRGDLLGAEHYITEAVAMFERLSPNTLELASALSLLGKLSCQRGEFDRATEYFARADAILIRLGTRGPEMIEVLQGAAETERHKGNLQAAQDYYRRAIDLAKVYFPSTAQEAELLAGYARVLDQVRQSDASAEEYQLAIDALDGQLGRLGGTDTVRSGFRAAHEDIYQHYADLLIRRGNLEESFDVIERSRARTLLELLTQSGINIHQHVDPKLRAEEGSLRKDLAAESDRRVRLLAASPSRELVQSSDARMAQLLRSFAQLESHIRDISPTYADLTQPTIATTKDVRSQLLDSDTLLLEYSLGQTRSYLWLVSSESASVYTLPACAEIEREARLVYRATAERSLTNPAVNRSSAIASAYGAHYRNLSRMILGPVESLLGNKRLLLVPDGALSLISFAALPLTNRHGAGRLLLTDHEIVYLPSASILIALRHERTTRQSPPRAVAVLADPVFDPSDPRIKNREAAHQSNNTSSANQDERGLVAQRSVVLTHKRWTRDLGLKTNRTLYFSRLPYSRSEAQAIMAAIPEGQTLQALDFKASRTLAMSPDLAQYRILHFATHGLVDTTHPEFSGLLFSLFDQRGAPELGLLSLADIYNLNLPVDMVVLSACQTALGKEVRGEGLMGLTRGFMYAGASRVVASLWDVSDVATTKLMARFYRAMGRDRLPAAAALRKAQLEMQNDKQWAAPYYWAGFELQGEWK